MPGLRFVGGGRRFGRIAVLRTGGLTGRAARGRTGTSGPASAPCRRSCAVLDVRTTAFKGRERACPASFDDAEERPQEAKLERKFSRWGRFPRNRAGLSAAGQRQRELSLCSACGEPRDSGPPFLQRRFHAFRPAADFAANGCAGEGHGERFRSFAALVEEAPGRGEAFAAVGLHKQLLGGAVPGKCAE